MRSKHLVAILVLLMLTLPAAPAHAGGVVSVCDETHLLAALAGGGTVTFVCSGTITLTAEIVIAADTTIDGSGQTVTISGNNAVRVFYVNAGVTLNLNKLAVANGYGGTYGGGIYNNGGTLTVGNSTFLGNRGDWGGAISNRQGGTLTVSNCTFRDNGNGGGGGGISNGFVSDRGRLDVSNSTFSSNDADHGGGIFNGYNSTLTVTNSTFSRNTGAGILNYYATATLKNTIVTNHPWGGNCDGPIAIIDGGGNLSYPDTTCPGINASPMLGRLEDNGGPTETMALGPDSAAIDAGIDAICAADPVNSLDQRGIARPRGPHCDIGAVEQEPYPSLPYRRWLPAIGAQ